MGIASSPPSDYPAIFRHYVEKSVQCLLTQVEQAEPIIPPDDVEQALHTLSFALKLPAAWPNVREFLISIARWNMLATAMSGSPI